MSLHRPLWDALRAQAALRPDALAMHGPSGATTYARLARDVDAVATVLLEHGLSPQDMVGLQFGFSPLHLLLILALDRLGVPSMSFATADAPTEPGALAGFGLTAVISGSAAPTDAACRWIQMAEPVRVGAVDVDRLARLDAAPDALIRVCWSSGTTGGAKGMPLTRALQAERVLVRRLLPGIGPRTRYFPGLPFSVGISYVTALATLAAGGAVILPSPASDFVALANALKVTLTLCSPSLLATLLGDDGMPSGRLETVEMLDVLGAQLPAALARRAHGHLTPNLTMAYGVTEIGRVAVADAAIVFADPAATGFVIPWVDLQVVDPADRPLTPGREGLVRIRSAQMIAGYLNNPRATQQNFRDGWFYSGDVGVLTEDRLLRVTGRVEDLIRQDGGLVSPLPIEDALRRVAGVRDVAVFSLADAGAATVCAALVLAPGATPATVRAEAAQGLGERLPARLFVVEQLPRNTAGKVVRRELAEIARRERLT